MVSAWLLCTCLVAAGNDVQPAVHPRKVESESQVTQALQAEAKGLDAERLTHLARAMALDPANTLARGLLGLVEYQGRWQRSETVEAKAKEDPARAGRLREYLERRAKSPAKADAQIRLAEWCEQNGLKDQAIAHYRAALRLDPSRELAWRRLGYKKQGSRWARPEDLAAEKAEAEAQKKADREWKPRLERIRDGLLGKDPARREKAEADLAAIHEPRAVPMILAILASGGERLQLAAVQALGQIEGPSASAVLADLSVLSASATVRQTAASALLTRDPRDVVGRLIGLIRRPVRYKVIPGNGPGTVAQLLVEGEAFDLRKVYRFPDLDVRLIPVAFQITNATILDNLTPSDRGTAFGERLLQDAKDKQKNIQLQNRLTLGTAESVPYWNEIRKEAARWEALRQNAAVQEGLEIDTQILESARMQVQQINDRTLPILRMITGQDLGADPDGWQRWWTDQLGYASSPAAPEKPVYDEYVGGGDVSLGLQAPILTFAQTTIPVHSCFAAGTTVRTIDGPRPIETIAVGDLVLSQDTATGNISLRPVAAVHHNAPAATLRLRIGGETITATGIHRFWNAGHGWTMARDLKPGDRVRMVGTSAVVESVTPDIVQPVYNLEIEGNPDFFVGRRGVLVHDNSFVRPVEAPFDRLPSTVALVEGSK